jgi:predicted permease
MRWSRFRSLFGLQPEADVEHELAFHIEMRTRELVNRGESPERARELALQRFGDYESERRACVAIDTRRRRKMMWADYITELRQDLRYGLRTLGRAPGFTATALVTLAIGIGANAAVFSVVNSVVLKPLPYPDAEQLVAVSHSAPGAPGRSGDLSLSPSMFFTYADENRTFQDVGVWIAGATTVTGLAEPEEVRSILITHGVLQALKVPPMLGRWLDQSDQIPQGPATLMLSYGYWQRRFGGDPSVIGRTIAVGSRPREIVGVMPDGFRILDTEADVIVPFSFDRSRLLLAGFVYNGIARLKPGMTIADANADIARMLPIWMSSWRSTPGADPTTLTGWRITPASRPLKQEVVRDIGKVLWIVMATVGIVMLIACANVANLLLVRGEVRQQELAIRAALGAGVGRIVRALLLEGAWLGLVGGVLGLALAYVGLRFLVGAAPASLPRLSDISIDPRALMFTFALSLLSTLIFGLLPAIKSARPQMTNALHSGGRALSSSRQRVRWRNVLVVAQVALAVVLLVSAVLMIRSFQALLAVPPGFAEPQSLQTTRIAIPVTVVQQPAQVARMQQAILEKLAAIPGVTSVAFSSSMPMEGVEVPWEGLEAEGATTSVSESPPPRRVKFVSPGLFQTTGTPLVAGRDFTWTDLYERRPVAIVSENLARELWTRPPAAVGKRIRFGGETPWRDVIGVSANMHDNGVHALPPTTVYYPVMVSGLSSTAPLFIARSVAFAIRSPQAGTPAFLREVEAAVWSVNKNLALTSVRTMQDAYDRSLSRTSFTLAMLTIAAAIALILAVVGVYGMISYVISLHTREMGIRLTLGLQPAAAVRMFVSHGLVLVGLGVLMGLGLAVGVTRSMAFLLFGIRQVDPVTYVAVPSVLALAAVLASYLPARRAATLDPVQALKSE